MSTNQGSSIHTNEHNALNSPPDNSFQNDSQGSLSSVRINDGANDEISDYTSMFKEINPPSPPSYSFISEFCFGFIMIFSTLISVVYAKYGADGFKNAYYTIKNRYLTQPNRLYDIERN